MPVREARHFASAQFFVRPYDRKLEPCASETDFFSGWPAGLFAAQIPVKFQRRGKVQESIIRNRRLQYGIRSVNRGLKLSLMPSFDLRF